jgi:D-glycero-beta-D-manno-heptose-7-phosphate kinase
LGDLILDRYLHVNTHRQSAEAPIPVYEVMLTSFHLGGAGNVLANIAGLGAIPYLLALGGNDCWQAVYKELLQGHACTLLPSERKTTLKTRIICDGLQVVCFEEQDTHDMEAEAMQSLKNHLSEVLSTFCPDIVILQDYDRGFFTAGNIPCILDACNKHNVPVAVDPKYRNFSLYSNVALFKPNLSELQHGTGSHINTLSSDEMFVQQLEQVVPADNYLITLSEKGMLYANKKEVGRQPSLVQKMLDVSGAGDTVISVAALGLACGWELGEIAWVSSIAAAIACETEGVHPVSSDEIQRQLEILTGKGI